MDSEQERHDLMKRLAEIDYANTSSRGLDAVRQERVPLTQLLAQAMEITEHARELEKRLASLRDECDKINAAATEAWNEYARAFTEYVERSGSKAIGHSEVSRFLHNNTPSTMAGIPPTNLR